jgi:thiol-disulfide isomerase/thioredoxin
MIMKIILRCIIFLAAFGSLTHTYAQKTFTTDTIIFQENFNGWTQDSLTANGWSTITVNYNYISPSNNTIQFFKQVNANWMLLITPGIDLTNATMLIFNQERYSSVSGMQIKVGVMTNPTDTNTFQMLDIFSVNSSTWVTDTVFLSGLTGVNYLAFNGMGPIPYTLFNIDNVIVKGVPFQANWPSFVTNLNATAGPGGVDYAIVSWTNPSKQADGDALTDLDSVVVNANGLHAFTLLNPVIGGDTTVHVNIPQPGFYIFTVTAYNTAGASTPISTDTLWVGLDTPGPVQNLVMTVVNDSSSLLNWTAPVTGAHGAFYDGVVGSYEVIRADGTQFSVDGNTHTFSETLTTPGTYNYQVIAVNTSGYGASAFSNAGAFYFKGFLLAEDYWVEAPAFGWTESGAGTNNEWSLGTGGLTGGTPPEALFWPMSWLPFTGTHRMISPMLNTTGKTAISLDFLYYAGWNSNSFIFKVETTSDSGTTWHDTWVSTVTQTIPAQEINVVIKNTDVGSPNFQFSYTFVGYNEDAEIIAIDAVRLYPTVAVDIAADSLTLPDYIRPGNNVVPTGSVKSYGSLDTSYTATLAFIEGTDTVYKSTHTSHIIAGATQHIVFDPWTAVEGNYTALLKVYCAGDENTSNNTIEKTFGVYNTTGNRTLVVCEEFTGTWCAYCPGAAMGLDDLITNAWPVAVIAYHINDTLQTPAGLIRNSYYDITGLPTVQFDGIESVVGGNSTLSMYQYYWPIVQARMAISSSASVSIDDFTLSGSTVTGNIVLGSASSITNKNLVLHVVVTESGLQVTWENQTVLNFVQRDMIGDPAGIPVDLSTKADTIPIQFTLSSSWVKANCELVAFLQDTLTKEVYNGNMISLDHLGISEHNINVALYPVPAHDKLMVVSDIQMNRIEIVNITGQVVSQLTPGSKSFQVITTGLQAGIYIIRITTEKGVIFRKVIIN